MSPSPSSLGGNPKKAGDNDFAMEWQKEGPHVDEIVPRHVMGLKGKIETIHGRITHYASSHERRPELHLWEPITEQQHAEQQHTSAVDRPQSEPAAVVTSSSNAVTLTTQANKLCVQVLVEADLSMHNKGSKKKKNKRNNSNNNNSNNSTTNASALPAPIDPSWIVQERMDSALHSIVHRYLLKQCFLQALLEEAWSHYLAQQQHQQEQSKSNFSFRVPSYYFQPNNSHAHQPQQQQQHDVSALTNTEGSMSIPNVSAILHRIRAGAQLAYNLYTARNVVRKGSSVPPQAASKHQPGPHNIWQKGGRVAKFLLDWEEPTTDALESEDAAAAAAPTQEDDRQEQEEGIKKPPDDDNGQREEDQEEDQEQEEEREGEEEQEDAKQSAAKSKSSKGRSKKKTKKTNKKKPRKQPKTELIDAFLEDDEFEEDFEEQDEDFHVDEDEPEDEEELEAVVQDTAVLDDAKKRKKRKRMKKEDEQLTDDEEEEEDDDDETDYIASNPYWKPTKFTILEWLGRRGKSTTLVDLQQTALDCFESQEQLEASQLSLTDQQVLGTSSTEESWSLAAMEDNFHLVDPTVFGKCRFFLTSPLLQEQQFAAQALAEKQEKQEKTLATWRFKSIHDGYTKWPTSWQEVIQEHFHNSTSSSTTILPDEASGTAPPANTISDEALAQSLTRRSTRRANATESSVFYGSQTQMSQKQLMGTILRFCQQDAGHTMTSLQALVAEESTNPVQRLRTSLGRLVWKRHQLVRDPVSTHWNDKPIYETLQEPEGLWSPAASSRSPTERLDLLARYIVQLQQTELQLRHLILKHLTAIPVVTIATAADERQGTLEALDGEGLEEMEWQTSGHDWIGKLLYRPSALAPDDASLLESSSCRWYRVYDYIPSVPLEDAEAPNTVERRMRFRVRLVPSPEEEPADAGQQRQVLVLTQGQVHAGMLAAKQEIASNQSSANHPFTGGVGTRITLRNEQEELSCVVTGYNTVCENDQPDENEKTTPRQHRLLVLPVDPDGEAAQEAFWTTLQEGDEGGMTCTTMTEANPQTFQVDQSDYDVGAPAYYACMSVVDFLKKQKHSNIFLEPVDPVALNIPTYFSIIKEPMDISTLQQNLENGVYSRIPVKQSVGRTASARMLNGPFRDDAVRIFDNAILFNPPDDWIHQTAISMKKSLLRKLEQVGNDAEGKTTSTRRSGRDRSSVYVDEDSDVDIYEYESDHDDEYVGTSRRNQRKRKRKRKAKKDDFSSVAVEGPIRLQSVLGVDGLRGPFAALPIVSDATGFSLGSDWTCRHSTKKPAPKLHTEMDDLLALQRQAEENEKMGLRRSARSTLTSDGKSNSKNGKKALSFEYVLREGPVDLLPDTPSNRFAVEAAQEYLHEKVYAKWYQQHWKELSWKSSNVGVYANGSFPPYLGTVTPCASLSDESSAWEIRSEYVVAAIRWVIRGLVHSGHLTALDRLSVESLTSGVIMTNDVYTFSSEPFDVVEVQRKNRKRSEDGDESSEEDIELSEYEKLRASRVARNAERLKMLGLG